MVINNINTNFINLLNIQKGNSFSTYKTSIQNIKLYLSLFKLQRNNNAMSLWTNYKLWNFTSSFRKKDFDYLTSVHLIQEKFIFYYYGAFDHCSSIFKILPVYIISLSIINITDAHF